MHSCPRSFVTSCWWWRLFSLSLPMAKHQGAELSRCSGWVLLFAAIQIQLFACWLCPLWGCQWVVSAPFRKDSPVFLDVMRARTKPSTEAPWGFIPVPQGYIPRKISWKKAPLSGRWLSEEFCAQKAFKKPLQQEDGAQIVGWRVALICASTGDKWQIPGATWYRELWLLSVLLFPGDLGVLIPWPKRYAENQVCIGVGCGSLTVIGQGLNLSIVFRKSQIKESNWLT